MPAERPTARLFTFASAGWVLVLAAVLVLGIVVWQLTWIVPRLGDRPIGDGRNIATYRFDLTDLRVPRELLAAGGLARDGLPRLDERMLLRPDEIPALNEELGRRQHIGKAIAGTELVVGVTLAGQARAYPLRILALHEVVNDELAGIPILVTYSPLCDSVAVFDRRVAGRTIEFGFSGLLYNSNLLMYDRGAPAGEASLWSQLAMQAISGPHAGTHLDPLPAQIVTWQGWVARHPDTRILLPAQNQFKRYKRVSYGTYYSTAETRFPVAPEPPPAGRKPFERIIAVRLDGAWHVFGLAELGARCAESGGVWHTDIAGRQLRFTWNSVPPAVWVDLDAPPDDLAVVRSLWFAWYAIRAG